MHDNGTNEILRFYKSFPSVHTDHIYSNLLQVVSVRFHMRFFTVFFVLLIVASLIINTEGAKKKKRKRKKKVIKEEWKEPEVPNLWDDGGYIFRNEDSISDPRDPMSDLMKLYRKLGEYMKEDWDHFTQLFEDQEEEWPLFLPPPPSNTTTTTLEFLGDSGLGLVQARMSADFSHTLFVGHIDTNNGAKVPESMESICNIQSCIRIQAEVDFSIVNLSDDKDKTPLTVDKLVEKHVPSTLALIQDNFISMTDAMGKNPIEVICVSIDPIHTTLIQEIKLAEDNLSAFRDDPKSNSGAQTDQLIPELFESTSARILLRLVEKLCKKSAPEGSTYSW